MSTTKPITPLAFILNVRIKIHPTSLQAFLAAIRPAYEAVLREEECVFFNLGVGEEVNVLGDGDGASEASGEQDEEGKVKEEPYTTISFSEGWNCTLEHFQNVQLKRDYYVPYQEATVGLWLEAPTFEIVRPQEGFCHYKVGM